MTPEQITERRYLHRTHWMTPASRFETYSQTPNYSLAFAGLYGQLAIEALAHDPDAAIILIHKATRHAWVYIFAQEAR